MSAKSAKTVDYDLVFDALLATYEDGRRGWVNCPGLRERLQRGAPKGTWRLDRRERVWFRQENADG